MFVAKVAIYGLVGAGIFAISTFSTIQIAKANRNNVATNDDGEEEVLKPRQLSDTEKFINSLSCFGNMKGNVDVDLNYGDYFLKIDGNVFVSMETIEDIQVDADLTVDLGIMDPLQVKATYLDNTAYLSINDKNLKVNTNDIQDLMSLFESEVDVGIPLSEIAGENFSTDQLLNNLGIMEAVKSDYYITYTCNLLSTLPPVVFTSDNNYNMTSVSIEGINLLGITGDIHATTKILGNGHNEIKNPETLTNTYVDVSNYFGAIKQVKSIVDNKELGLGYDITVKRDNKLVFNIDGDADVDFKDLKNLNNLKVNFNGHMVNKTNEKQVLDSTVDIKVIDGGVYFDYNNRLKLSYQIENIEDLVDIIAKNFKKSTPTDLSSVLGKYLPSASTLSSPIFNVIKNKDFLPLLDYYKDINFTDNQIVLTFDASILGEASGELLVSVNTSTKQVESIVITNLYAFGYTLDMSFTFRDYQAFEMDNEQKNSYNALDHVNGLIDNIAKLTKKDQFDITLNGKVNLGKGDIVINGSSFFAINQKYDDDSLYDYGLAELNILDNNNHPHKINIDVTRNKVDESASKEEKREALHSSDIKVIYNDKLNASFNLLSISDSYDLIQRLASEGNPLLAKIAGLLATSAEKSTLDKVREGDIEAILYDNSLNAITYDADTNSYDIELSGALLSSDGNDNPSPIDITIYMDGNDALDHISIITALNGLSIDLNATFKEADTSINHERITFKEGDKVFKFNELDTLLNYLFNTAQYKDFHMSGNVNLGLVGFISKKVYNIDQFTISADVHINEDGTTIAKVATNGVPFIPFVINAPNSTMYIIEEKVGETIKREVYIIRERSIYSTQRFKLTGEEFTKNIAYYLVNIFLGVSDDIYDAAGDTTNTNNNVDYAKILTDFNYKDEGNIPSWNLTIDLGELAGNNSLNDAIVTIKGSELDENNNGYLNYIKAKVGILSFVDATIVANVNSFNSSDTENSVKEALDYQTKHTKDSYNTL